MAAFSILAASRLMLAQVPVGSELQVNTATVDAQNSSAVGLDEEGDLVVVWDSAGQDGAGTSVRARRFGPRGTVQSPEIPVNSFTVGSQQNAVVGLDADGDFVVVWVSSPQDGDGPGIFARRFDAFGAPQAIEFQVNSHTFGIQEFPALARRESGGFIVAWTSAYQDSSGTGIFARRFGLLGSPLGGEFQVNAFTNGNQTTTDIAVVGEGDFVVVWSSLTQDGSDYGVFGRRFASSGQPQGVDFQINAHTFGDQLRPAIAGEANGGFVVAWHSDGQDGSDFGIFARRFDAGGGPVGGDVQVSTYSSGPQLLPAVASGGAGDFVVTWQSSLQDGSSDGVFAQRFAATHEIDVDGDGEVTPLTDGLLILRFLFGFSGNTLVTGAVDVSDCTRCTAPEIEAFLGGLL